MTIDYDITPIERACAVAERAGVNVTLKAYQLRELLDAYYKVVEMLKAYEDSKESFVIRPTTWAYKEVIVTDDHDDPDPDDLFEGLLDKD